MIIVFACNVENEAIIERPYRAACNGNSLYVASLEFDCRCSSIWPL